MASFESMLMVGLVLFLIIAIGLALLGWYHTDTMADFAIAGETLGPYMVGAAFAATFYSAATFVGYVGWSYGWGTTNLWTSLIFITASPVALILFAKQVREVNLYQRSVSLADWIGDFYDSDIIRAGLAVAMMFNLFYIAAQLSAGALIFELFLGWEYINGLIFITVFVTLYVFVGGTFADIYTDTFQAILMAIMGSIVFVSALWVFEPTGLETWTTVAERIYAQNPDHTALWHGDSTMYYNVFSVLFAFTMAGFFTAQPQLFNKVLAINDAKNLRKMIMTFMTFSILFLGVVWGGLYMYALGGEVSQLDNTIYQYILGYFPPIVGVFLALVILAAALATTDGIYVVLSTAIANDIFKKIIVKRGYVSLEEEKADLYSRYLAQISVLLIGVVCFFIVLSPPMTIAEMVWVGIGGVASASVPLVLIGIYAPNLVTRKAGIAAMVSGMIFYICLSLWVDSLPIYGEVHSVFTKGSLGVIFGSLVLILGSLITDQEEGVAVLADDHYQQQSQGTEAVPSDD